MPITGTTTLLGLIGTPVEHSKSPAMYNHCFRKYNLDYAYLAFDIPVEETEQAVQALRTFRVRGANVTMPCKNAVLPFLDDVSPAAAAIGAVNTIVNDGGRLTGHSTDGCGYTNSLRAGGVSVQGVKITLLGGGGAANAIAIQAALEGAAALSVFNLRDAFWPRVEAGLEVIRKAVPACKITLHDLQDTDTLKGEIAESAILSNATRVGMAPLEGESSIRDLSVFRRDLIVTDTVYAPVETKLLREAKAAGCRTFDGLGMLLHQGAAAFTLYTGLEMPVEEVRELLYQ